MAKVGEIPSITFKGVNMQNLNIIQDKIKSENIKVLKPQSSYKLEVSVNTSKLGEIPILGNPFLTKFKNGQVTLACIEYSSRKKEDILSLLIEKDSNQLVHLEEDINIWFRRIVSSPRGKGLCWETRPAYLEDLEEMDTNSIADNEASILYKTAFGF